MECDAPSSQGLCILIFSAFQTLRSAGPLQQLWDSEREREREKEGLISITLSCTKTK